MSLLSQDPDVRTKISLHLENNGIKRTFLAKKVEVSSSHLSYVLDCTRPLTDDLLKKINVVLKTQFERTPEDQVKTTN